MLSSSHIPHRPHSTPLAPPRPGFAIRDARIGDLGEKARLHVRGLPMGLFPDSACDSSRGGIWPSFAVPMLWRWPRFIPTVTATSASWAS